MRVYRDISKDQDKIKIFFVHVQNYFKKHPRTFKPYIV